MSRRTAGKHRISCIFNPALAAPIRHYPTARFFTMP